jgi:hypothetical protein
MSGDNEVMAAAPPRRRLHRRFANSEPRGARRSLGGVSATSREPHWSLCCSTWVRALIGLSTQLRFVPAWPVRLRR